VRQQRGSGRPIARDVIRLGGCFLEQLRAHVLEMILELDFLGNGHAVMGDGRGAPFLIERYIAALWTQSGDDCLCQNIHTMLKRSSRFATKNQLLCHSFFLLVVGIG